MTGERSKVRELDTTIQGSVKFGNKSKVRTEGRGMLIFQCKNGDQRKLKEVYYIPELCSNIICLGQPSEGGDEISIKQSFLRIYDSKMRLLMKVQRSPNFLYKTQLKEVT